MAGLFVSTLKISSEDFLKGNYALSQDPNFHLSSVVVGTLNAAVAVNTFENLVINANAGTVAGVPPRISPSIYAHQVVTKRLLLQPVDPDQQLHHPMAQQPPI